MKTIDALTVLSALAQDTRLSVYRLLVEAGREGLAVGDIGTNVKTSPATLSFHLKELSHAHLIRARQDGRFIYYSAKYEQMNALLRFLTKNCCHGDPSQCPELGASSGASSRDRSARRKRARAPKRQLS